MIKSTNNSSMFPQTLNIFFFILRPHKTRFSSNKTLKDKIYYASNSQLFHI